MPRDLFANPKRAVSVLLPMKASGSGGEYLDSEKSLLDFIKSFQKFFLFGVWNGFSIDSPSLFSNAVEFKAMFASKLSSASLFNSKSLEHIPSSLLLSSNSKPYKLPLTTFILFSVNVPVLSEQTAVAQLIISQDLNTLTRLASLAILVVANARANVTAKGKPSGTATTTIVIAVIKIFKNFEPF
ncbi:hypothetical protein WICMUC_000349 [Wickerhamomyces mucosus]|uniref:Uncharacterized protein n=1 Tax=Wickerhamomyces mucosus TaxID=1378264 RepID=A0A9P8TI43_9ASCO|nr:hypothetical protein WICMUC_000349 [Wickerhamomyces mucosus]